MISNSFKKNKQYRLFLINPKLKYPHYGVQNELSRLLGKKKLTVPLALPIIAALTPEHYAIRIIDEDIETLPLNIKPDIVGITTLVSTINRAYEIADWYRSKGVTVVMGGSYATFMTEDVLKHADSVIMGEAENKWKECLLDFEKGKLKKIYSIKDIYEFKKNPIPRWDLVDTKKIMTLGVQASRGCPYRCEFCLVSRMFGRKQRFRDVDDVINEISLLPLKRLFFVDDNLTFNKSYAKELMKKLKPLGASWVCQSSIDVANDEELLQDMADAGCLSILIGFESLNSESLKEAKKFHNKITHYENAIQKIHEKGIQIIASFVVGFDADTLCDFDRIYEFTLRNNLPFVMLSMLTVAPGTDLYDRMKGEGRLYEIEPYFINGTFPCMQYKNISPVDMIDKFYATLEKIFFFDNVSKKAINLFSKGTFNREGSKEVGFIEKVITSITILKMFYFTRDKTKRKLFKDLFSLALQKKLGMDKIVFFLTSMAGFNEYIEFSKSYINEIKEKIRKL